MSEAEANDVIVRSAERARHSAEHRRETGAATLAATAQRVFLGFRTVDAETVAAQQRRADELARAEAVGACHRRKSVPDKFRTARVEDFSRIPADALERYASAARRLANALANPGLYVLCGEIGDGKTHMTCGLINAFCDAGRSAKYVKTKDFIDQLRRTWRSDDTQATARFEREHVRFALLVIDEWQARNNTENEEMELFRLLDKRYDAGGATVIISNHADADEVYAALDARVADRMCDGGGVIVCDWPSLRGRLVEVR
ncbi:MAG TPA: ATP-binding protein [Tepidisphaeraceae bacterium]|jgi:DNA replication protein DnaC|nr:ATP-binding protein [Tepidisphaeraceae bacterium]